MKCDGCPIRHGPQGGDYSCRYKHDCHLAPASFAIIEAMLAGEAETLGVTTTDENERRILEAIGRGDWKCEKCRFHGWCHILSEEINPCAKWQPRDKPCPDQFDGLEPIPDMPEPEDLKPCPGKLCECCNVKEGVHWDYDGVVLCDDCWKEYAHKTKPDKLCPSCDGRGDIEIKELGAAPIRCTECDGEGFLVNVSGERFKPPTKPCPKCKGRRT